MALLSYISQLLHLPSVAWKSLQKPGPLLACASLLALAAQLERGWWMIAWTLVCCILLVITCYPLRIVLVRTGHVRAPNSSGIQRVAGKSVHILRSGQVNVGDTIPSFVSNPSMDAMLW